MIDCMAMTGSTAQEMSASFQFAATIRPKAMKISASV